MKGSEFKDHTKNAKVEKTKTLTVVTFKSREELNIFSRVLTGENIQFRRIDEDNQARFKTNSIDFYSHLPNILLQGKQK